MTGLVVAALAMIGLCVALAVVPLWRHTEGARIDEKRRETNIDAYRQRMFEVDIDVAAGRLELPDLHDVQSVCTD